MKNIDFEHLLSEKLRLRELDTKHNCCKQKMHTYHEFADIFIGNHT